MSEKRNRVQLELTESGYPDEQEDYSVAVGTFLLQSVREII